MPSKVKKDKVKQLKKWFEGTDSLLVLHYKGLRVADANELREVIKESGGNLRVLKNTLTRIALTGTDRENLIPMVDGPIAVIFVDDDLATVARAVRAFSRDHDDLYFQGGMLAERVLSSAEVDTLAALPSRDVMVSRAVGYVSAPLNGFVTVCVEPIRKLLGILVALGETKKKEEPEPAAEVEGAEASESEAPVEEEAATAAEDSAEVEPEEAAAEQGDTAEGTTAEEEPEETTPEEKPAEDEGEAEEAHEAEKAPESVDAGDEPQENIEDDAGEVPEEEHEGPTGDMKDTDEQEDESTE